MNKSFGLLLALAATTSSAVFAQQEQSVARTAVIKASKVEDQQGLKVYEVECTTEEIGNIVSTTVEFMIENRTNRILEGEFEFPLGEGESVTGYALDIDGKFRNGVAVEKEKGRVVFEDITRRGVDPGLIEKTEGNNFKTRVYPIPASGVRHLKITYDKEINVSDLPASKKSELVDKVFVQTSGKDTFFYFCEDVSDLYDESKTSGIGATDSLPAAKKTDVYIDVSSSAASRNREKELDFLEEYFRNVGGEASFYSFSNGKPECVASLKNVKNFATIKSKLLNLSADGATNLNLDLSDSNAETIFIISDGMENWNPSSAVPGTGDGLKLNSPVPDSVIHTVCAAKSANFSKLKKMAAQKNGVFINLEEVSAADAVEMLAQDPLRILEVNYNESEIVDVYPLPGTAVGKSFSIAGNLKKKNATVTVKVGRRGKVLRTYSMKVSSVDGMETEKIQQLWAQKKIDELSIDYEMNRSQIIDLAKKYTIVTQDTSLIVLDSVNDYVRYGIVPPAELRDEYNRLTSGRNSVMEIFKLGDSVPDSVFTNFREFEKWWNKKPEDFKKVEEPKKGWRLLERSVAVDTDDIGVVYEDRAMGMMLESTAERTVDTAYDDSMPVATNSVAASRKSKEDGLGSGVSASPAKAAVELQAYSSDADYLTVFKKTRTQDMYKKYLELKKTYSNSPMFYMEVSDAFEEEGLHAESMKILSNLAEMNLENTDVLRALGNKLVEREEYLLAASVFKKLISLKAEVPQFYRDYALAMNLAGYRQEAVDSLWNIVRTKWDNRYDQVQQIALNDMNSILESEGEKLDTSGMNKSLLKNFDMDLRIVLTWNTDNCDVDLWVTDPANEKCYYGHKLTAQGGRMSRDFTMGYGPEEFCIKSAPKGTYKIQANYFGNHQQKLLQPVIVQAEVYTNFGRPSQKRQVLTLQLNDVKQTFDIGSVTIK